MGLKQRFVEWLIGRPDVIRSYQSSIYGQGNTFDPNRPDAVSVATTCVKILAETLGRLPLGVWITTEGKGKVKDSGFYLHDLLHRQPNKFTTANTFFQTLEYHRNFKGNAFARIHRNGGTGRVEWLEILSPSRVKGYKIVNNELYYVVLNEDRSEVELNHVEILHFKMMTPDGVWGINPIEALMMNLGVIYKGQGSMDKFYENNALSPKALKSIAGGFNTARSKEMMENFEENYTGLNNAGKWIKLPPNTEVQDLSINFADAQIIESLRFNSQQVSAMYGVPVFMATGDYTQSKFNSIEAMQIGFKVHTIAPIVRMYKAELESKLLLPADLRRHREIEFNLNSLVEPDTKTKTEYYGKMATIGAMTPQQIAIFEGLPADDAQNVHLIQTNLMSLEQYNKKSINQKADKDGIQE